MEQTKIIKEKIRLLKKWEKWFDKEIDEENQTLDEDQEYERQKDLNEEGLLK